MDTDLEKIQLPDFILANLYKDSLVVLNDVQPRTKVEATIETKVPQTEKIIRQPEKMFLGDNKKGIVIVVKETDAVYLNDESLNFLSSILGACKLNLGDVAIVNHHTKSNSYPVLKEELSPKFLLLFDVTSNDIDLPFSIPFYQVQQYDNCTFLTAPSLQTMLGNSQEAKLEKSKLWLSLKKIFGI